MNTSQGPVVDQKALLRTLKEERIGGAGFFGPELKMAGFDAIVFRGRSEKPVYLWVTDGKAEIKDASHLADLGAREVEDTIRTEMESRKIRVARFPWVKTLEQFDFSFQPSIDRKVVRELATLGFVDRAENVIILGPPGVGKTHLWPSPWA